MDTKLQGRIAIVTGASSGIGKATAIRLANSGTRVVCADLSSSGTEREIVNKHGDDRRALFVKCNVTEESEIQTLVEQAVNWGGRLDIMCNIAGISIETSSGSAAAGLRCHDTPTKNFDLTHSINERGVWLCCKHALGQMMAQEPREANARGERSRGWIINAASLAGLKATQLQPCYVPSKFAVVGLTKQLAADYAGDRIHVNCVCPGIIATPLTKPLAETKAADEMLRQRTPWGEWGRPEDIADSVLFLASDEASYITGIPLVVDGGYTTL